MRVRGLKNVFSGTLLLFSVLLLSSCNQTYTVSVTWVNGTTVSGSVNVDGEVKTFESTVGPDGCVSWDIDGCSGTVCGCMPGTPFKVTCSDPMLMQWPDTWTLTSALYTTNLSETGPVEVTPASSWVLPPEYGSLTTDSGHSAWVLKLLAPPVGPRTYEIALEFSVADGSQAACVKGLEITTVESLEAGLCAIMVPDDPAMGVDFTAFGPDDPNVVCTDGPVSVDPSTWGRLKVRYR